MRKITTSLFILLQISMSIGLASKNQAKWFKKAIERSEYQLLTASENYKELQKNPRSFDKEKVSLVNENDWTSGFFPGSLWYMYELTKNKEFLVAAERATSFVEGAKNRTNTHDLGFILYCSYGNGFRITGNNAYLQVLKTGAETLMRRFNPNIGLIRSWDFGDWQYPVIIDNMLNLEYLCEVGKMTGNVNMINTSISHADKTIQNHFRGDYSCFHVVNYDSVSGRVINKQTHQGFADNSSWARGQGWALYGYTMMYRETKKNEYLEQAKKVASFILNHPRLPKDKIPYWDFDAPNIPNEPRDASAAAVFASALLELSSYVNEKNDYFKVAEIILKNLSSDKYLAKKGENGLFVLKHSTGNWPKKDEIDAPLSYADYYYLEAMKRYSLIKGI